MSEGQIPGGGGGVVGGGGPGSGGQIPGIGTGSGGVTSVIELGDDTEFLNGALGQAGLDRITNISDTHENARWCLTYWPPLRKAILRMAHWNFAEAYASLAQIAVPPLFGFSAAYQLPPDLVKIREYNGMHPQWTGDNWMWWGGYYRVVGRHLYTNDSEAKIVYTRDVTTPVLWDAVFYQLAEAWLASKLARQPGKQPDRAKELFDQVVGFLIPLGTAVDGQEGTTIAYQADDLIWGRSGYGYIGR